MKKFTATGCAIVLTTMLCTAQNIPAERGYRNMAPRRSEFITYSTRNLADKGDRAGESFYIDLGGYVASQQDADGLRSTVYRIDLPLLWRDRDVFLHVRGHGEYRLNVNGTEVGAARDSRAPAEFFVSDYLKDGVDSFEIIATAGAQKPEEMLAEPTEPEVFLYSQPHVRIHDVEVEAVPDPEGRHGVLTMKVILSSSRNNAESITVGYDIYSPDKELKYYDLREVETSGKSLDTLEFKTNIYGAMNYLWSAENPQLYDVTLYLKRNRIITEYLPLKVGFGSISFDKEHIYRNGKAIDIEAAAYNAAADRPTTVAELRKLKAQGINTLYTPYPQPYWFYDVCDAEGFYVVDRANINTNRCDDNRRVGGTLANDPAWSEEFVERQKAVYYRSRMHPCIIAWSLGAPSGGGYCMYKAYEWFKSVETVRPIVYADGEWNNDLNLPEPKR